MKFSSLVSFLFIFSSSFSNAQLFDVGWLKCYGGSDFEIGGKMLPTSDGGYILIGQTNSNDYDVNGNDDYKYDGWVVKLRANGEILWQRTLPSFNTNTHPDVDLHDIKPTSDGGYIAVGVISPPGDIFDYVGLVVKLDNLGNIEWQKYLGDSNAIDSANGVAETEDGGYMVLVNTALSNGLPPYYDFWLLKLSENGEILWDEKFGGEGHDVAGKIYKSSDGGYLLTGTSSSDEGEFAGNHGGGDILIIKVNESGSKQWMKLLGGSGEDHLGLSYAQDGGFIGAGFSESNDGDVTSEEGIGWLVKFDENMEIQWQKKYDEEGFSSVLQTPEGDYLLVGKMGEIMNTDIFIKRVDGSGNFIGQLEFGGSKIDYVKSVFPTQDGKYIISGYSYSQDETFSGNHGGTDFWMMKFDSMLSTQENNLNEIIVYPNPVKDILHFSKKLRNIKMYSMNGYEVLQEPNKTTTVDVSSLPYGMYILRAETAAGKKVNAKFAKN